MKTKLILLALVLTTMSCTKTPSTTTPKTTAPPGVRVDSTEQLLIGKWLVEKYIDTTNNIDAGVTSPGFPQVTTSPGSTDYIDFRTTRNFTFLVGTDTIKKDCMLGLFKQNQESSWWYDKTLNTIVMGFSYNLLKLSNNKLVIRYVVADVTTGTNYTFKSRDVYLYKP